MRATVLAAGGIVLRHGDQPLFAVVRMRKRGDWVLPKGKLEPGETTRQAAEREVLEETGHRIAAVHEYLGTLAYEVGGRSKVVHFWRMDAEPEPSRPLMKDIRAVDWLPLREATLRLTRAYEQAFLAEVGPLVLAAAAGVAQPPRATPPDPQWTRPPSRPAWDAEPVTELADAPSLALEQPAEHEPRPSLLQRLRAWLRGRS
ncbi:NUDIX domain-containing protein [Rhodopseudomonas sp. HC1]|uniref:NUDIX hydrolase n=1 Tax=Rhodopseudomonas infernalis TaxID=2897386 RepID=UPI001EE79F73|nr:NUDIX domain-containing protein [Rhodopseudomonas infernalis]MCG6207447.1 NUDIX domain-containing protein [Rhodopseudomonas infernalis]